MRKLLPLIFLTAAASAALISCHRQVETQTPAHYTAVADAPLPSAPENPVHAINLPLYQPVLPDGPAAGREAFARDCLTCHSTRYIAMQPPMSAAKWEENVRKMAKTYAAHVAEADVAPIVQYLVTTRESSTGPETWSSMTQVSHPAEPPPMLVAPTDAVGRTTALQRGARLDAQNCASCHGATGKGDGTQAAALLPRPTDLTSARYSLPALSSALYHGVPATPMPSFRALPIDDLRALALFTQSLSPATAAPHFPATDAQAKTLYMTNCLSCHGAEGRGDGPASATLPRPPANFHLKQPTPDYATKIISDGVPGTTMPAWKDKLSDSQRQLLVEYVRSLFDEAQK